MENVLKKNIYGADENDIQLRTKGVFRPVTKQIGNSLADIKDFYKAKSKDGVVVVPSNIPPRLNNVKKSLLRHLQPDSFLYEKNLVTGNKAEESAETLLILMDSLALAMATEVKTKPSNVICDVLLAVCNQPVFVLTVVDDDSDEDQLRKYNISVARGVTRKLKLFMDERVCVVYGVCYIKELEDTDTFRKTLKEHARLSSIFIPQKTFESYLPKFNSIVTAIWASVAETNSVKTNHKDKGEEVKRFLTKDQCVILLENINKREVTVQYAPRSGATTLMLEVDRRLSPMNDALFVCSSQEKEKLSSEYPNMRLIDHQATLKPETMRKQQHIWKFVQRSDTNISVLEGSTKLLPTSEVSEPEQVVGMKSLHLSKETGPGTAHSMDIAHDICLRKERKVYRKTEGLSCEWHQTTELLYNPSECSPAQLHQSTGDQERRERKRAINSQSRHRPYFGVFNEPINRGDQYLLMESNLECYYSVESPASSEESSSNTKLKRDHQRQLLDSTREKISIRTEGMIQVSAVDLVIEKLKHGNNWITITGNAGDGKTTLGYFVLKEFVDKMSVYVIETPEDYRHISKIEEDRIILLNDIFGAFNFDSSSVNKWGNIVSDIFDIQMKSSKYVTKVVFVCRKNILQELTVQVERSWAEIANETNWFDLSQVKADNDHIQIIKERLQILDCHLLRKGITLSDRVNQRLAKMDTVHGFPHCCEMYAELVSKGNDIKPVDFFQTPLQYLDKNTKLLFKTGYKELFINLVKSDGKVNTDRVGDGDDEVQAKCQEGSYLEKSKEFWKVKHPSIYESVLHVVAENCPLLFVKHASMSVIRQNVRFTRSEHDTTQCSTVLRPRHLVLDALADRFVEELTRGDFDIFRHSLSRNEEFCQTLIGKYAQYEIQHDSPNVINNRARLDAMVTYASKVTNHTAVKCLLKHGAVTDLGNVLETSCLTTYGSFSVQGEYFINFRRSEPDENNFGFVGDRSMTRLSSQCRNAHLSVEFLPLRVDHTDKKGNRALHYQCEDTSVTVEALQLLIDTQPNVDHTDRKGKTALHYLCGNPSVTVEALQLLIDTQPNIDHTDKNGKTALHYLCANTSVTVEALQLLTDKQPNVDHTDTKGKTALHYLCGNPSVTVEALQLLIDMQPTVDHTDNKGKTALHYLFENPSVTVEALQLLIDTQPNVDHTDRKGKTALHYLCGNPSVTVEALQLLIDMQPNVDHTDKKGKTALDYLCGNTSVTVEALQLLIDMQPNVDHTDKKGKTALHYLCGNTSVTVEALQLLIDMQPNVDHTDKKGKAALDYLCGNPSATVEARQLLINMQPNVDHTDKKGKTALDYLFENPSVTVEARQLPIDMQPNVDHTDKNGKIPV